MKKSKITYILDEDCSQYYKIDNKIYSRNNIPNRVDMNNLLNPKKVILFYIERRKQFSNYPVSVEIHPTALCNYHCSHCSYKNRNKVNQCLDSETMDILTSDLVKMGVKSVYFSGGGEPTLLKNWHKYLEYLLDNGIECALITNGSNLKGKNKLLNRLNYLAISIYNTDKDVYNKVIGGNYKVQFNPPKLSKCIVGARCVVTKYNQEQIDDLKCQAILSGYDYFLPVKYVNYEGKLPKCHYKKDSRCHSIDLELTAYINYDGEVYLCQPLIGNKEYSIGNIKDNRLTDIWESPKRGRVLPKLHELYSKGKCSSCRCIAYNQAIDDYDKADKNTELTVIKDNLL